MTSDILQLPLTKVSKAVKAVIASAEEKRKNDVLADDEELFQVQVCLKKIPPQSKTFIVNLPNSILKSDLETCLFVKDLNKTARDYEPTIEHFQELFSKKGVTAITEILPLKALRHEYQPYEAKRNLSNAYDVFLADESIVRFLPRLLGKHFYGAKKNPVQVNLRAVDLKKEINKAINTCRCTISSKGSSSMVTIGHMKMSQDDLAANIIAFVQQLSTSVPGGSDNIKQLLLKTMSSLSVPVYISTGGPQGIMFPKEQAPENDSEPEEISSLLGAKVKVFPDGRVLVINDGETEEDAMRRFNRSSQPQRNQRKRKRSAKQETSQQPSEQEQVPVKKVKAKEAVPVKKITAREQDPVKKKGKAEEQVSVKKIKAKKQILVKKTKKTKSTK